MFSVFHSAILPSAAATRGRVTVNVLPRPGRLVTAIERVVDGIELRAFELAFDHVASFDGGGQRRPWVLRGSEDGLERLPALRLVEAPAPAGFAFRRPERLVVAWER